MAKFYIVAKKNEDIDISKLHVYMQWASLDAALVKVNVSLLEIS